MANQQKPGSGDANQGEGNREAARRYNADSQSFAKDKDQVKDAAGAAKKAVEGKEGKTLTEAEKHGLAKARH